MDAKQEALLPDAVKKAGRKADALHKEMYGDTKKDEPENPAPKDKAPVPQKDGEPEPAPQPAVDPQPPGPEPGKAPTTPIEPEPPKPSTEPPKDTLPEVTALEQRLKTLEGKYNAEVRDVQRKNRELEEENRGLKAVLRQSPSEAPARPAAEPESPPKPVESKPLPSLKELLTDEDRERLDEAGVDEDQLGLMTDIASRLTQRALSDGLAPIREEVKDLKGKQTKGEEDRYLDDLKKGIPDLETIDESPEFNAWLDENDPVYGIQRLALLQDAQAKRDVPRIVRIVNTWKDLNQKSTPPPGPPPPAPKPSLENQVVPDQGQVREPVPQPVQGNMWKSSEITAFYTAMTKGAYSNRPDEAKQIEADIWAAQKEGRVAPG